MRWVVSVKGVVFDATGAVLLGLNDRDEWELPGGQPEPGEEPADTVVREVAEESGLVVSPDALLRSWVFEPIPGAQVLIISYGCTLVSGRLSVSAEHTRMQFHPLDELDRLRLPDGYRHDIEDWADRPDRRVRRRRPQRRLSAAGPSAPQLTRPRRTGP